MIKIHNQKKKKKPLANMFLDQQHHTLEENKTEWPENMFPCNFF